MRAKVKGTIKVPRLCVFRSNQHIYAQLIDDENGKTIVDGKDFQSKGSKSLKAESPERSRGAGSPELLAKARNLQHSQGAEVVSNKDVDLKGKTAIAKQVGFLLAQKAKEKGINKVVFDRSGYKYHGRVKALADGARGGGLKF